jgi:hypothetical protein
LDLSSAPFDYQLGVIIDSAHFQARRVKQVVADAGSSDIPMVTHVAYQHDPKRAFAHSLTDEPFVTVNVNEVGVAPTTLTYKVSSDNPSLVTASPSTDTAIVTNPVAVTLTTAGSGSGYANITVTGTDADGKTGTLTYRVRVPDDGSPPDLAIRANFVNHDESDSATIDQNATTVVWLLRFSDPAGQAVTTSIQSVTGTHADLVTTTLLSGPGANQCRVQATGGTLASTDYTVTITVAAENEDGRVTTLPLTLTLHWPF